MRSKTRSARAVFFNRLGEIRDRSYETQRHRASGLNLLVAAIILWNTTYLHIEQLDAGKRLRIYGPLTHLLPSSTLPHPTLQPPVAVPIFSRSSAVGSRSI